MKHRVKKCRACHSVVYSGDLTCANCHAKLKKPQISYFGKKKKEFFAFFNKLLDVKIETK